MVHESIWLTLPVDELRVSQPHIRQNESIHAQIVGGTNLMVDKLNVSTLSI